jgi:hypothetical protein
VVFAPEEMGGKYQNRRISGLDQRAIWFIKEGIVMIGKTCFFIKIALICLVLLSGCTTYERQVVSFQLPESNSNAVNLDGAIIAARSFADVTKAKNAFGFDIRSAGILPVQVIFDNKSKHSLVIVPAQTFLIDDENNAWPILDQGLAYERLAKRKLVKFEPEAAKSGWAVGVIAGVQGMNNTDANFKINDDLQSKSLQNRVVTAGELAYGFIFYPGEAKTAKVLRLQLKDTKTGQIYPFNINL